MHAWADVAELTKTKTLTGGLVARSASGLPFLLHEGLLVAFVPPQLDAPRRARVSHVRDDGRGAYVVTFEGVDAIDVAERLVGCHCLVRRADLPDGALALAGEGLVGFRLIDRALGPVGTIEGVASSPGQLLLEVDCGRAETALVPLVDDFLVEWDEDARTMLMDLPAGLLDV